MYRLNETLTFFFTCLLLYTFFSSFSVSPQASSILVIMAIWGIPSDRNTLSQLSSSYSVSVDKIQQTQTTKHPGAVPDRRDRIARLQVKSLTSVNLKTSDIRFKSDSSNPNQGQDSIKTETDRTHDEESWDDMQQGPQVRLEPGPLQPGPGLCTWDACSTN